MFKNDIKKLLKLDWQRDGLNTYIADVDGSPIVLKQLNDMIDAKYKGISLLVLNIDVASLFAAVEADVRSKESDQSAPLRSEIFGYISTLP